MILLHYLDHGLESHCTYSDSILCRRRKAEEVHNSSYYSVRLIALNVVPLNSLRNETKLIKRGNNTLSKQTLAPVKVSKEITLHDKCKFVLRYITNCQKQAENWDATRIHWINLVWKNREANGEYTYSSLAELYSLHFGIAIETAKPEAKSITEVLERQGVITIAGRKSKTGAKYVVAKLANQIKTKEKQNARPPKNGLSLEIMKAVAILDRDFS